MGALITYNDFEALYIQLGNGVDTFTIETTILGRTVLRTGGGADVVRVKTIDGSTTVATEGGDDRVTVSSDTGVLNQIAALLTLDTGAGTDTVRLDDAAETNAETATINPTTVTGLGHGHGHAGRLRAAPDDHRRDVRALRPDGRRHLQDDGADRRERVGRGDPGRAVRAREPVQRLGLPVHRQRARRPLRQRRRGLLPGSVPHARRRLRRGRDGLRAPRRCELLRRRDAGDPHGFRRRRDQRQRHLGGDDRAHRQRRRPRVRLLARRLRPRRPSRPTCAATSMRWPARSRWTSAPAATR